MIDFIIPIFSIFRNAIVFEDMTHSSPESSKVDEIILTMSDPDESIKIVDENGMLIITDVKIEYIDFERSF